jgi:hypothetical protein
MKKLAVDMEELALAFETGRDRFDYFFDLETGATIMVTEETNSQLESLYELAAEEDPGAEIDLPALLAEEGIEDWEAELLLDADQVEREYGARYVRVPHLDSPTGYRDMEDFIGTVEDAHLRDLLEVAIQGRGAFRRFKDVLLNYEDERQHWFAFKDARVERRVVEWLASHGIEPLGDDVDP